MQTSAAGIVGDSLREAPSEPGRVSAGLFQRILLGATTALLAARMIAPGEDPGMLGATSGPADLLLPLGWLLVAVGVAVWRLGSRRGDWRGGVVEAALLMAVALVFVSAEGAAYRHAARLIAWDWLTLFLVVCLIRLLATSSGDQQALFAVLLAGVASLSAQAVYQAFRHAPASATFAQAGPFAAWLALFLPGLLAAAYVCRPGRAARWQTALTVAFALLGAVAFGAAVVSTAQDAEVAAPSASEVWRGAWGVMESRPWLGVGPGNFSRAYPRFQPPGAGAVVTDPGNFLLELGATCGVFVLSVVLVAFGAFFVQAWRRLVRGAPDPMEAAAATDQSERVRWEYYIGGMCGLVLGLMIRLSSGDHAPADILAAGLAACGRCLIWLTAFALFERVAWPLRTRLGALAVGVAASLLVLLVRPGVGMPSVAVPLWAVVALGLNALPHPAYAALNRLAFTRILPAVAIVMVLLFYFLVVFIPVTGCAYNVQSAAVAGREFHDAVQGKDPRLLGRFRNKDVDVGDWLSKAVLAPLDEAAKSDPDDARVPVLQAQWRRELWVVRAKDVQLGRDAVDYARSAEALDPQGWDGYGAEYQARMEFGRRLEAFDRLPGAALGPGYRVFLREGRWPNPLGRAQVEKKKRKYRDDVLAKKAEEINPYEPAIQYLEAASVLEAYLPNDPNDAELRFRLAETLFKAWEDDECREQAEEALRLDAASGRPPLTVEQRRKLYVWKDLPRPPG